MAELELVGSEVEQAVVLVEVVLVPEMVVVVLASVQEFRLSEEMVVEEVEVMELETVETSSVMVPQFLLEPWLWVEMVVVVAEEPLPSRRPPVEQVTRPLNLASTCSSIEAAREWNPLPPLEEAVK